ncbi:flagellar export chaperone FliS [Sulfurivirga sp.]|uniref:flagellar export chaperone FliS n=1 Tax=Sulfurivirga sp. TaxID=2614236 RepID=UPI0025EC6A4C|nr:flagellar export chaperone FliS [Sulfurivirga sp.]
MNAALRSKLSQAYANTGLESVVLSATPHKRVSLLYDGAVRHVRLARIAVEKKDIPAKARHTGKAMDIVSGLRSVLNHEHGEQLTSQLDALYEFILRHLLEASKDNSADKYQTVLEILETLKDGWDNMPEEYRRMDDAQLERLRAQAGQ